MVSPYTTVWPTNHGAYAVLTAARIMSRYTQPDNALCVLHIPRRAVSRPSVSKIRLQ